MLLISESTKLSNANDPWVEQILLLPLNVLRRTECQEQGEGWSWRFSLQLLPRKHEVCIIRAAWEVSLVTVLRTPVHKQLLLLGLL
jgi:hypothetical protein